jgi:hypothetical protein
MEELRAEGVGFLAFAVIHYCAPGEGNFVQSKRELEWGQLAAA